MRIIKYLKEKFQQSNSPKEKIIEVKKDTDLYNLVNAKMTQYDFSTIAERMENLEKVVYYLIDAINALSDVNKKSQEYIVAQSAVIEELIYTFEQVTKALNGGSSYTEELFSLEKSKKTNLN